MVSLHDQRLPYSFRAALADHLAAVARVEGDTWGDWMERDRLLSECQDIIHAAITEANRRDEERMDMEEARREAPPVVPFDAEAMLTRAFAPWVKP